MENFGKMWTILGKWPFFGVDMAGLGKYHTGGYGRIGVYRDKVSAGAWCTHVKVGVVRTGHDVGGVVHLVNAGRLLHLKHRLLHPTLGQQPARRLTDKPGKWE